MSKPARALRSLRRPPHQWGLVCWHVAWCVVSKPGQAPPLPTGTAAPSGALHSRLLSFTGAAGDSRETVIAFAGMCSVSGETDDTFASQIHLFLALFHRAKASWVSYRRPEAPALVLTVTSRGAVSGMGARKFAQRRKNGSKWRFYSVLGEFCCECGRVGVCWANFGFHRHLNQAPKPSIGTEAGSFRACLPSRPAKPAAYADRLLRYG